MQEPHTWHSNRSANWTPHRILLDMNDLTTVLAVARGDRLADLRFTNARVVNVLTEEVEETDIVISGSWIAGVGPGYEASSNLRVR